MTVNITNDLKFYLDKDEIIKEDLEARLLEILPASNATEESKDSKRAIVLRAEEKVPYENIIYVMDIANRNQIKMVAAVNPK